MKVYNISDESTPQLENRGLVNQSIRLGDTVILPGTMAEVHLKYRSQAVQRFSGALAVDSLPPSYKGRARPKPTQKSQ